MRIAERVRRRDRRRPEPPAEVRRARGLHARRVLRARHAPGFRRARWCSLRAAGRRGQARVTRSATTSSGSSYEIEMIKRMGYPGYFLIVWDFIRYAREQGIPVGPGPRLGGGQPGRLGAADHRRRSALLRPHLRALPQSRARVAARYRRRLLRAPPRRGDRVRHAQVRPRERLADHHLRHDEGQGGGARRRPRHGHAVRGRRSHRQADSAGARHDAREGAGREPGAAADAGPGSARQGSAGDGQAPRGHVAQRRRPRRRRRHRARARSPTTRRSSRATATKSRRSGR